MLYSLNSSSYIDDTYVPHQREYDMWRSRLSDAAFNAIYDELHSRIDGSAIQTSSWIPGSNWEGTVFQPIYDATNDIDALAQKILSSFR